MVKNRQTIIPKRGEFYLVSFDPSVGAEIKKIRPALILQNDIANRFSPTVIVAAATSRFEEPLYPTEILIKKSEGGLSQDSVILLNQIKTIDKTRLIKHLGKIKSETMERVNRALEISLGLIEI